MHYLLSNNKLKIIVTPWQQLPMHYWLVIPLLTNFEPRPSSRVTSLFHPNKML